SINKGLQAASGDIFLLLNDDIILTSPVLSKITKLFENTPNLGVLGALLRYPNKMIQHAGMVFSERHRNFLHLKHVHDSQYMIAVTGAFFAVSKELYQQIGGLDEKFFLACEDTQYCLRAWAANFRV